MTALKDLLAKENGRDPFIVGNVAYVPLTRGKIAVIDAADIGVVANRTWWVIDDGRNAYAASVTSRGAGRNAIMMHRLIIDAPVGTEVDHIDGNGLNNVRSNLRLASKAQNQQNARLRSDNKSGEKGVFWRTREKKWGVSLRAFGVRYDAGSFSSLHDAVVARDALMVRVHGEFARVK